MQMESTIHSGAPAGEAMRGDFDLPSDICEVLTQIMLYVIKMDEDYLKYIRKET